jgi:hypothetical protein
LCLMGELVSFVAAFGVLFSRVRVD